MMLHKIKALCKFIKTLSLNTEAEICLQQSQCDALATVEINKLVEYIEPISTFKNYVQ